LSENRQCDSDRIVPEVLNSPITDKARLTALIAGLCAGISAPFLVGFLRSPFIGLNSAQILLIAILTLSFISGCGAALFSRKELPGREHAMGVSARIGMRAGIWAVLVGGSVLILMATSASHSATSAALDRFHRGQMWLTLAVSLASVLPSVLCGFLGGITGAGVIAKKLPIQKPDQPSIPLPWLKWLNGSIAAAVVIAFAAPLSRVGQPLVVDPPPPTPPVVEAPPSPPPFRYEPPQGIKTAGLGEIQPDFSKIIPDVQSSCPVALSPDGTMIAFGDASGGRAAVGVFDLHRFSKVASIVVPAFPHGLLAWAPDRKSIACTLGEGASRRIWILKIETGAAIELPRPPGRDVPGGDLFWWQEHELSFFPEDEAPLAFNLEKLELGAFEESPAFKKLDDARKTMWIEGPRSSWPEQTGWRLGLRTTLKSAIPPARREPDSPWELSGQTICAYEHPKLPLAFGFKSLSVNEGDKILCSADGSKIIRLLNGQIEVTFMKKAACPDFIFEVEMPLPLEEIGNTGWRNQIDSKMLCLLVYAPLRNPLNNVIVGPDYNQVRALARLVEWKGRKAVFIVQTHDESIEVEDVASTLHYWEPGKMSEWKPISTRKWWAAIKPSPAALPDKLPELESPQLLSLIQEPNSLLVMKAVEKPSSPSPKVVEEAPVAPTPAPPPSPVISEQDVKAFLSEHHAKASRGDVAGMMADYDRMVDFLDKGRIPVANIESEEKEHRQKWQNGSEQVVGVIFVINQSGVWNATYTIEFYNENTSGDWHKGRADLSINMRTEGGRLYITSQRAKVYNVTDSRASSPKTSTPAAGAAKESKGAAISVPRPCFVTVTRAKDAPQIEFTDQISFVKGIVWHRTYRELSSDGKVLRTCRAIYTGSGGVSPDRNTARIYVTTQEWDQGFGDGLLTGVCQRSAQSMVGKAFQFQFVTGGMVESQLGMVFQLQK
jgi:hypothetical protein